MPVPLTREQIELTPWAKRFRSDCLPSSYEEALRFVCDPRFRVAISQTNERGPWEWAIVAASHDPSFWLDSFPTKKAALDLCREMGWKRMR